MSQREWVSDPPQDSSRSREWAGGEAVQQHPASQAEMVAFKARTLAAAYRKGWFNVEQSID